MSSFPRLDLDFLPDISLTIELNKAHESVDEALLWLIVLLQEEVQYKGTVSSESMSSGIKGGAGVAALTLQSP